MRNDGNEEGNDFITDNWAMHQSLELKITHNWRETRCMNKKRTVQELVKDFHQLFDFHADHVFDLLMGHLRVFSISTRNQLILFDRFSTLCFFYWFTSPLFDDSFSFASNCRFNSMSFNRTDSARICSLPSFGAKRTVIFCR